MAVSVRFPRRRAVVFCLLALSLVVAADQPLAHGQSNQAEGQGKETGRTQNERLRVVPAPNEVRVDGRLDDWDRSGRIFVCGDLARFKNTRSANVMAMHGADGLYVALEVNDPTPLQNTVDPAKRPGRGWRGDCLQLRMKLPGGDGPARVYWLDSWYHAAKSEPVAQLQQRRPDKQRINALAAGAEATFRRADDEAGYVQELFLPWSLFGREEAPEPGFSFRMGLQLHGGENGKPAAPFHIADLVAWPGVPTGTFYKYPRRWGRAKLVPQGDLKVADYETWQEKHGGPVAVERINEAEGLITPFFEGALPALDAWQIESGEAYGLKVDKPFITGTTFSWQRQPDEGPALRMTREFDAPVGDYDRLVLHASLPDQSRLRLTAETDKGQRVLEREALPGKQREYTMPLEGATRIKRVTIEVFAGRDGAQAGRLGWLGTQNTERLDELMAYWRRFDARWQGFLEAPRLEPAFEPMFGIFITREELEALRERHAAHVEAHGESPLADLRERAMAVTPEDLIRQAAGGPGRFGRDRGISHSAKSGLMARAAIAALILEDKDLLRRAARYAMAVSMIENWHQSFYSGLPGSTHDHRAFNQSKIAEGVAIILDAAGELMTRHGRAYVTRRLARDGVQWITFNSWRYEYIHHMNQLAWFSDGWMAGYGVLAAQNMPRVKRYAEIAHEALAESMSEVVLEDGGYEEGPSYFATVAGHGGEGLYYYSRFTDQPLQAVTPESLQRTADFAEVIRSTADNQDIIPFCDSWGGFQRNAGAFMAALLPDSAWVSIYRQRAQQSGTFPVEPMEMALEQQIPETGPEPEPFVQLSKMGLAASTRRLGDHWVKLLVVSNIENASHNHEDKGSFVLELAGQTFAADPGQVSYDDPRSQLMKHAQRHNMLLPYGLDARPAPTTQAGLMPAAEGDKTTFSASMDLSPRWEGIYKHWQRTIESPSPDQLVIVDEYALARGDGVEFNWNTFLPVEVHEDRVVIEGERGRAVIAVPADCDVRVDELSMPEDPQQKRIVFRHAGETGRI